MTVESNGVSTSDQRMRQVGGLRVRGSRVTAVSRTQEPAVQGFGSPPNVVRLVDQTVVPLGCGNRCVANGLHEVVPRCRPMHGGFVQAEFDPLVPVVRMFIAGSGTG